jgi:glycerol-3-phosphate dehydrogenase subunit C
MAQTITVLVERYDPDRTPAAFTQAYEVESHPYMTVLELLAEIQGNLDDSLVFRSSCKIGKCGSCAVSLDGRPALACRTLVRGPQVRVGPLAGFPRVRDLIVDRAAFEGERARLIAGGRSVGYRLSPTFAALPDAELDYANLARCIGCLVCNAACPVAAAGSTPYSGPALLATSLSSGVRTPRAGSPATPVSPSVDYCSLCLNCQAVCPSGVGLDRANARAKSHLALQDGHALRDRLMGRVELLGRVASRAPVLSNGALRNRIIRYGLERTLRISRHATMVPYAAPFRRWFAKRSNSRPLAAGVRRVAYFAGCYGNYSDTRAGRDMVAVLERLGIAVTLPSQRCCGLPMVGNGDLTTARRLAEANVASFSPWLEQGYDVVTTCTSCSLMLRHEYTEILDVSGAAELARRTFDLGEYLRRLVDASELYLPLEPLPLRAAYHAPCHLKVQQIGLPFVDLLGRVPELDVQLADAACCGLSGSYGFKLEKYNVAQRVGRPLFSSLLARQPGVALSECGACMTQIRHGTGLPVAHPVTLLREALCGPAEP